MKIQIVMTPTGPLSVIRPVAEQLLTNGVISGQLDGELHAADAATVKAAIMSVAVCDFCAAPGASHRYDVPDFDFPEGVGRSVDGWAACDACSELVEKGWHKALLDRSVAGAAFPKFSRAAIGELHTRFWQGHERLLAAQLMVRYIRDYVDDLLPDLKPEEPDRTKRIQTIARMLSVRPHRIEPLLAGDVSGLTEKLWKWHVSIKTRGGKNLSLDELTELLADDPKKPLPDVTPHWQRALDARFAAMTQLSSLLQRGQRLITHSPHATDLSDMKAVSQIVKQAARTRELEHLGFGDDIKFLRAAQAYSFSAETTAAILEASLSVPHDAPLSSIETPNTGAGWFWFGEPLPISASPIAADCVNGLLWGWTSRTIDHYTMRLDDELLQSASPEIRQRIHALGNIAELNAADIPEATEILRALGVTPSQFDKITSKTSSVVEPAICFSAYVIDERGVSGMPAGTPSPSTRWFWPLHLSVDAMVDYNSELWERDYGKGSPYEHVPLSGKDVTVRAIREMSLFFVMACLWFRQTVPGEPKKVRKQIFEVQPGHVERHARKRFQREHDLAEPPTVQVVALRKTARMPSEEAPAERQEGTRNYGCRWIVRGHPRLQACGPGRKDRKLIWIDAHPAGPEDKPLRVREKVFAVVR